MSERPLPDYLMNVDGRQEYSEADTPDSFRITAIFEGPVRYYRLADINIDLDLKEPRVASVAALVEDNSRRIKWVPVRDLPEEMDSDVESVPRYRFEDLNRLHDLVNDLNNSLKDAKKSKTTITYYKQPLAHPDTEHPQIPKRGGFALRRKSKP